MIADRAIAPQQTGLGPIADDYRRFLRIAAANTTEPLTPRQQAAWDLLAMHYELALVIGRHRVTDFRVRAACQRYRAAVRESGAVEARVAFAAAAKSLGSAWTQLGRKVETAIDHPSSAEHEAAARRWKGLVRERGVRMRAAANDCIRLGLRFP